MYKAQFVQEKGKYKGYFVKNRAKFIYQFLQGSKYTKLLRYYNIVKSSIIKWFKQVYWKKAIKDLVLFMINISLEGLAINFITFVIFGDSLHVFKFLAYGLFPAMLIHYYLELKNGTNSTIREKESNTR